MAMKMIIRTPARIHITLLDLNGSYGRIDGGIGFSLQNPQFILESTQTESGVTVEFDESIQLEIEGKIHTQYCKAGQLIAVIKKKHSLSKYHNGLDADGKRLTLINVGEAPKFDVQITKYSVGEIISKSISSNDIKLEYRKGTNGDFHHLSDQSINEVGYYQLRLTYSKTNKSIIIPCFALNENARVHSELNNPRTDFQNLGAVNISCEDTTLKEENDTYRKYLTNLLNYNTPIALYRMNCAYLNLSMPLLHVTN